MIEPILRDPLLQALGSNELAPNQLPDQSPNQLPDQSSNQPLTHSATSLPLVSLVVPAFREAAILEQNLQILCDYMTSLEHSYQWEIVVVNDGSPDDTGDRAEAFARTHPQVRVVHHLVNCGLGQALRTGFEHSQGDYIVTLDLDLSYAPETHIQPLLSTMQTSRAKVVVASPYMPGGKVSNVPWLRLKLSIWANRFLSLTVKRELATLTGMVRAYDGEFIRGIHSKSQGMDINPELLHKARLLDATVQEIPAHLHWRTQRSQPKGRRRKSSMKIARHTWDILVYGFIFSPVMFFLIPSLLCLGMAVYSGGWATVHCWSQYQWLASQTPHPDPTEAVAMAFQKAPHTFFIGGMSLMIGMQFLSLGILSAQSKHYFEEVFHLGTAINRKLRR
jgi:glycosyltransferase involved in cell wall biosynthesis